MSKDYIIITGGETVNKGAQSMLFITINEMKKIYPDKKIVVFSESDYEKISEVKDIYNFTILPNNIRIKLWLRKGIYRIFSIIIKKDFKNKEELKNIENIYKNAYCIIDISGYALSSQWNNKSSINFMNNIIVAKKYDVPIYLFPQSFGPFNYKFPSNILFKYYFKRYLKYPKMIYAREKEGYDYICKYTKNNVELTTDMVLSGKEIDLKNIYCNPNKFKPNIPNIPNNSVAIIPNKRNLKYNKDLSFYNTIINKLIEKNKNVVLIKHSEEDGEICKKIKQDYIDNDRVILLTEEYDCISYNIVIKQFDYAIASRYHSIVHSYKNGVPCIAIGWATKYHELLKLFNQEKYILDVRKDNNNFISILEDMNNNYETNSNIIKDKMKEIENNNIFKIFR